MLMESLIESRTWATREQFGHGAAPRMSAWGQPWTRGPAAVSHPRRPGRSVPRNTPSADRPPVVTTLVTVNRRFGHNAESLLRGIGLHRLRDVLVEVVRRRRLRVAETRADDLH